MLLDYLVFMLYATMKYCPSCPGYDTILPEYKTVTLGEVPRFVTRQISRVLHLLVNSRKKHEKVFSVLNNLKVINQM